MLINAPTTFSQNGGQSVDFGGKSAMFHARQMGGARRTIRRKSRRNRKRMTGRRLKKHGSKRL